jgi:hypothetical protein
VENSGSNPALNFVLVVGDIIELFVEFDPASGFVVGFVSVGRVVVGDAEGLSVVAVVAGYSVVVVVVVVGWGSPIFSVFLFLFHLNHLDVILDCS